MRKILIGFITLYQWTLAGLLPRQCRFLPSCSCYAKEAIHEKGVIKGTHMGILRLLRCHPWGGEGGIDPVLRK